MSKRPHAALLRAALGLALAAAAVYVALGHRDLAALPVQTCTLASNPCADCKSTASVFQCNPGGAYSWGYCASPPTTKPCGNQLYDCKANPQDCANPPNAKAGACNNVPGPQPPQTGYESCTYPNANPN